MNRRHFILGTLSSSALLMLPNWAQAYPNWIPSPELMNDISPLQRISSFAGSSEIEGDTPDEAHEIFWNKDGYIQRKGGIPKPIDHFDVVIVGGGISGLVAAYELKDKKILLIDGNPRMGGNAKVQSVGRSFLSQGSAYITIPENGGMIDRFLSEMRLKNSFRKSGPDDETVTFQGKFVDGFWKGATDPVHASEFLRVRNKLNDIYETDFPELPLMPGMDVNRAALNALDNVSLKDWMRRQFGTLHPHIEEYFHQYCWSSFCCSYSEISAAQGLNFITSDMQGTQALPGGNGMISQALFERLRQRSNVTMIAPAFAVDIKSLGGKVQVCFKNTVGELKTVTADSCVAASPKLVLKDVISDVPADQRKAMDAVNYRAYLVANIFLNKKIPSKGYDLFALHGAIPQKEYEDSRDRVFADIVFADWAGGDKADRSILTLYIPIPYDMGQQYLFSPDLYNKYLGRVRTRLEPSLKELGMGWSDVSGMRLVRYGHALPVAGRGQIANGTFEKAHQDIDGCIHFAHNDNWGNPCFETSFAAGKLAAMKIRGEA